MRFSGTGPLAAHSLMHLIQILLPLYDNAGEHFPALLYSDVKAELTHRFGGLTAHVRSPAEGRWVEAGQTVRDEIVIYEVMAGELDEAWWASFGGDMRAKFRQEEIVIRALPMKML